MKFSGRNIELSLFNDRRSGDVGLSCCVLESRMSLSVTSLEKTSLSIDSTLDTGDAGLSRLPLSVSLSGISASSSDRLILREYISLRSSELQDDFFIEEDSMSGFWFISVDLLP